MWIVEVKPITTGEGKNFFADCTPESGHALDAGRVENEPIARIHLRARLPAGSQMRGINDTLSDLDVVRVVLFIRRSEAPPVTSIS